MRGALNRGPLKTPMNTGEEKEILLALTPCASLAPSSSWPATRVTSTIGAMVKACQAKVLFVLICCINIAMSIIITSIVVISIIISSWFRFISLSFFC